MSRIVEVEKFEFESKEEISLRPVVWEEYIGQEQIKKNLGVFILGGVLWGIGASILWTSTALAGDGIVFVDLQEVFKRFYKTQLAQDQLRQQSADTRGPYRPSSPVLPAFFRHVPPTFQN